VTIQIKNSFQLRVALNTSLLSARSINTLCTKWIQIAIVLNTLQAQWSISIWAYTVIVQQHSV